MKLAGKVADRERCVAQLVLEVEHKLTVYGHLGALAALAAHDHGQIVGRDAELFGVEGDVAVLA